MKGFVNFIVLGVVGAVLIASLGFYTKYEINNAVKNNLGATIATTSLSDTINTFRTNTNTSLENINTQLESVSSTLGTVSSTIDSYGTMATVNSPAPVANGGTGTSTAPADGQFLSANGTTPTWKTLQGGTGITVSTTTTSTIITNSATVDTSLSYAWTGPHSFSAGVTSTGVTALTATTTQSGNLIYSATTTTGLMNANGTSAISIIAPSTSGNYLASNGTSWVSTSTAASYVSTTTSKTSNVTTSTTSNDTFTTGFPPNLITIYYRLRGTDNSVIQYTQGIASYLGTTLRSNYMFNFNNTTTTDAITISGGTISATAPSAGGATSNSQTASFSIATTTTSGFTITSSFVLGANNPPNPSKIDYYVTAFR